MKKLVVLLMLTFVIMSSFAYAQESWISRVNNGNIGSGDDDGDNGDGSSSSSGDSPEARERTSSSAGDGETTGWLFGAVQFPRGYRTPNYGARYDRASRSINGLEVLDSSEFDDSNRALLRISNNFDTTFQNDLLDIFHSLSQEERDALMSPEEYQRQINTFSERPDVEIGRRYIQQQIISEREAILNSFKESWQQLGSDGGLPTIGDMGWDKEFFDAIGFDAKEYPPGAQVQIVLDNEGKVFLDAGGNPVFTIVGEGVPSGNNAPVIVLSNAVRETIDKVLRTRQAEAYFRANFNLATGTRAASALNSMVGLDWSQWRNDFAVVFESDAWQYAFDQSEAICRIEYRLTENVNPTSNAFIDNDIVGLGPSGRPTSIVHIEGIRMTLNRINETTGQEYTGYVYRFTPKVVHPSKGASGVFANDRTESYSFRIILTDAEGRDTSLFPNPVFVSEGETWSRTGSGALVGETTRQYNRACIQFTDADQQDKDVVFPVDLHGRFVEEFCRDIVEQRVSTATSSSQPTGGGGSSGDSGSSDPQDNGQNQQPVFS